MKANYDTLDRVLALADPPPARTAPPVPAPPASARASAADLPSLSLADATGSPPPRGSSASSYMTEQSTDAKPLRHRIAELVSLRITSGTFYFCDMGDGPLIRLALDSAKLRYRYGAAACPVDECRKRFRVRLSGLRVSVADRETVCRLAEPVSGPPLPPPSDALPDNTDRMIRRVMAMGHKGISAPFSPRKSSSRNSSTPKRPRTRASDSDTKSPPRSPTHERRPSFRYQTRGQAWEARRSQPLPCADVLISETAVVDYVFDEPGPVILLSQSSLGQSGVVYDHVEGHTEETNPYPAPVCRVSVLLRGASFSYDMSAFADIERVMERLQPAFYDLMSLAMKAQSRDGKRSAKGIQIEVDATPTTPSSSKKPDSPHLAPLVSFPFQPRETTWTALRFINVRKWHTQNGKDPPPRKRTADTALPPSTIDIDASHISIRTEVPYRIGAQQKTTVTLRAVNAVSRGVVDMPLVTAQNVEVSRVLQLPQIWNEVHNSSVDVLMRDSQTVYLPDTMRVIDDLSTHIRNNMKKPQDVRYFIPFKETTRIRADNRYSVVVSCSHDNAWEDIHSLEADCYGKMRVCGRTAELLLSPGTPTEFSPDVTVLSWTLSLPSAVGKIDLPFPHKPITEQVALQGETSGRPSDSDKSAQHWGLAPSIARRVRSQLETLASHFHHSDSKSVRHRDGVHVADFIRVGKALKLTGKAVVSEGRQFLGSSLPAFLDTVDRGDISLRASSIGIDINPHHFSHFLNLARNYAGSGTPTLSMVERDLLHSNRKEVTRIILNERRYPFLRESVILGLGAGQALSSVGRSRAMDEILCFAFQADSLVVRVHELPHALSPFNKRSKNICSIESGRFLGSVRATGLGLELLCSPDSKDKRLTLHCEYREAFDNMEDRQGKAHSINVSSPTVSIQDFQVRKRSIASPEWGPYKSQLTIGIGSLGGCLLDGNVLCLSRIGLATIPDPLFEDQMATAALLSVDNIELILGHADVLILSTSSNASAERSGQATKLSLLRHEKARNASGKKSVAPMFLTGVTRFQVPLGARLFMSNLASETTAVQSRLVAPDISLNLLVSWGGKLTPWVDDATLRAQVAHAMLMRDGTPQGSFQGGLLRRAAELKETSLEVVLESRPGKWSQTVAELQIHHVSGQSEKTRGEIPEWCLTTWNSQENDLPLAPAAHDVDLDWWAYLRRSRRASILEKHLQEQGSRHGKLDLLSVRISSNMTIIVSPESLEVLNDVVIRSKEALWGQEAEILSRTKTSTEQSAEKISLSDLTEMWHIFEAAKPPRWSIQDQAKSGVSLRGLETKGFKVLLLSPLLPGEVHTGDLLFPFENQDDNQVFFSAPFGLHLLEVGKTEMPKVRSSTDSIEDPSMPSNVLRSRVIHASVPQLAAGFRNEELGRMTGIVVILREQSRVRWLPATEESVRETVRDDKQALVARIASVSVGRASSDLQLYASFGRIASVFTLMMRALALENASLAMGKNGQIEKLSLKVLPVPVMELTSMAPRHVRTFFSQASQRALDREIETNGKERSVIFLDTLPQFAADEAVAVRGNVKYGVVTSIDLTFRSISFKISNEELVKVDVLVCKGGSTARAQTTSELDGHVLSASFGTITLTVRDDIAANTLQMVSEVASFVRTATISMPMLRYDARRVAGGKGSSELLSYSYMNEEFLKATVRNSLEQAPMAPEHKRRIHFPLRSHASSRRNRGHWYSLSKTRTKGQYGDRASTHIGSVGASSQRAISRESPISTSRERSEGFATQQTGQEPRGDVHLFSTSSENEGSTLHNRFRSPPTASTAATDRRRERPKSSEVDSLGFDRKGWFNRNEAFEEDNEYFAYMAVPTAGESGPPRKRWKAQVRLTPTVPPAFRDAEHLSRSAARQSTQVPSAESEPHAPFPPHVRKSSWRVPHSTGQTFHIPSRGRVAGMPSALGDENRATSPELLRPKRRPPMTLLVSCREIASKYYRRKSLPDSISRNTEKEADISFSLHEPRSTFMSDPIRGSHSLVVTASSALLKSANNPNCVLTGSIASVGVTVSVADGFVPSTLPKLIASARISGFKTTLHATDLKSVLMFREEFKSDLKAVLSAFVTTKSSISEMARATRLSSAKVLYPGRTLYSTMAFDLLCEDSRARLEGFHPKDSAMCVSYPLDGLFFSVVASEDDNAALTLGLRVYGHGLSLSSPSWPNDEILHFPSLDARGVQWGETTGLPTLLKVGAEPRVNSTSVQGLRHVIFTVAGLMAFQNTGTLPTDFNEQHLGSTSRPKNSDQRELYLGGQNLSQATGATPFTRSVAAWERTKGVRMDVSIRPMSISMASGQVVARFDVEAITGIFEWNKLVRSGVQLHAAVGIPRISLMFIRIRGSEIPLGDFPPNERRASMSVALQRSRLDLLKTQDKLTHTFIFRVDVFAVSGQLRPWRLLLDAAVWADEQEFVSDLQAINSAALSSSRPRTPKSPKMAEPSKPLEHRVILVGANVQRFKLAVPLLDSEEYSSSRLALRATELHFLARQKFENRDDDAPRRNIFEVKSHFVGILWENAALVSSHHSRVTVGLEHPSVLSNAHFGAVQVVMVAGTWRICPRKDVVMAILEAKNGRENKQAAEKSRDIFGALPDVLSRGGSSVAGDSISATTERQGRLLVESLRLKILRTSGFIEGLEGNYLMDNFASGAAGSKGRSSVTETSKLTVPAFSFSIVRDEREAFDLVDVDFSGREGEFPRQCLQKVANLLTELFGAVASDQEAVVQDINENTADQPREISRDTSVFIRFGKSLYKAQEEANTSVESKCSFFAGRTSSILVSLTTKPLFGEELGHTTVISGMSPKLALEIRPLIEGAKVQSLRLIDARILHGISPIRPPHTLLHIGKVTALMDAKTLLLVQGRVHAVKSLRGSEEPYDGMKASKSAAKAESERILMIALGRSRTAPKEPHLDGTSGRQDHHAEPNIRLQLKLPQKNESPTDQVDIFAERLHFGICRIRRNPYVHAVPLNVHVSMHDMNIRAQWDIVSCKLRLRENLFSCVLSGPHPKDGGEIVLTNIMNRLQFESRQHGNYTMKLGVDALAAVVSVPSRNILIESTIVKSEFSHTMMKSILRLTGQLKKLHDDAKQLVEKEISKDSKRKAQPRLYSFEGRSGDSLLPRDELPRSRDDVVQLNAHGASTSSSNSPLDKMYNEKKLRQSGKATKLFIRGDGLSAVLRGYQFEETQHSAMVTFERYTIGYEYSLVTSGSAVHIKELRADFDVMRMSYNDDERGIHSELFRIPSPKLKLNVIDTIRDLTVELVGDLEVKLGPGFYLWTDFKNLSELTLNGIKPAHDATEAVQAPPAPDRPEVWDGRVAQVSVRLNPRVDVIGDLTADMLQFMNTNKDHVTIVPKHLYDNVVVHLEALSEAVCDPLCSQ